MKKQSDDKAKATTTIKSTPVQQSKPTKDELSEQELDKATGGTANVIQQELNQATGDTNVIRGQAVMIIRAKMN